VRLLACLGLLIGIIVAGCGHKAPLYLPEPAKTDQTSDRTQPR